MRGILSPASEAGGPPWTLAVEIIIIVSIFGVIDRDCPSLRGSGQGRCRDRCLGYYGCEK